MIFRSFFQDKEQDNINTKQQGPLFSLGDILDKARLALDSKITMEELSREYGRLIDAKILQVEAAGEATYAGGIFSLKRENEGQALLAIKLYFVDNKGQYSLVENAKALPWQLLAEALQKQIEEAKELEIDLVHP